MAISPTVSARPNVNFILTIVGTDVNSGDLGDKCYSFDWRAMMNGGYVIRCGLLDANFNVLKRFLVELQYFRQARAAILKASFRLSWPGTDNVTPWQTAYIIDMDATGSDADIGHLKFTGVDPPSWFLNCGDASGKVYSGRISQAIKQCVADYAPDIALDITDTTDSDQNKWYMMRQDPKTFISSLLDWSSSLTPRRGQWIVTTDDTDMAIKEQLDIPSNNVGFYHGPRGPGGNAHIIDWEMLANNALSIMATKLVASGISAVSGQYLDRVTDAAQATVFAMDSLTSSKYKANVGEEKAFAKPPEGGPPTVGWTAIQSIPEVYSAGDIGKRYDSYIDGRARLLYLNMLNMVQRARFQVFGHGIYYNCRGLGTDTVTIDWLDIDKRPFFLAGNWILYGYWHKFVPGQWFTHLYCARLDWNALATAVPAAPVEAGE